MHPKCIVLDEPTAMLDPVGRKEVIQAAWKLNKEEHVTIILITHYMEEVTSADQVIVMEQGKVLMQDTPEAVFHNREALQQTNLEVPTVLELFESLCRKGILDKALPAPKNLQALEKYIEEIPGH